MYVHIGNIIKYNKASRVYVCVCVTCDGDE